MHQTSEPKAAGLSKRKAVGLSFFLSFLVLLILAPIIYFEYWFVARAISSIRGAQTALEPVGNVASFIAMLVISCHILAGFFYFETTVSDPVLKRSRSLSQQHRGRFQLAAIVALVVAAAIPAYILYLGGVPAFTQASAEEGLKSASDLTDTYRFQAASLTMLGGVAMLSLIVAYAALPLSSLIQAISRFRRREQHTTF